MGHQYFFAHKGLVFWKKTLSCDVYFLPSHCEKAKCLEKVTYMKEIHPVEHFQVDDFLKVIINTNDMEP